MLVADTKLGRCESIGLESPGPWSSIYEQHLVVKSVAVYDGLENPSFESNDPGILDIYD